MKDLLIKENKRGWIKIVEAFVAILLIAGIILVILNKGYTERQDHSEEVYEIEKSILFQIQTNNTLRDYVTNAPGILPLEGAGIPTEINDSIKLNIPSYLECEAKICDLGDGCGFGKNTNKDVYAQSVAISGIQTTYNPRQLKIFCWMKG